MGKKAGIIGIGAMGSGMVGVLLENGYTVTAFDLNADALKAIEKKGVTVAASPMAVGKVSDVVITSLPSPQAFEDVVLGEKGLLKGMTSGTYIIDMSTIDPVTTRSVHEIAASQGVRTLDAPVSGGPQGAASGTMSVMAGGAKEDFETCQEILNILGGKVFYVGPIGSGQTIKICNNAMAAVHTVAMAEALLTGVKAGVDLKMLVDVIRSSSGNCWTLENFFPKTVLQNQYDPPLFTLDLMQKDVGLFMKTAEAMKSPTIMSAVAYQFYTAGQTTGKGSQDHTSVVQLIEALAGEKIGTIPKSEA
jgi:3-hydroxyisobutyrate dehydrogenase